jgi:hypothetical protein
MLAFQKFSGFIPLTLGALLCLGFKELKPSPLETGIITVLGKKVPVLVKGWVLLLDWLPIDIIGVVVIIGRTFSKDFKEADRIIARCFDGTTVTGSVSITLVPDMEDDPVGTIDWMSGGDKMILYDDNGQEEGVLRQVADMIVDHIKEIAKLPGHDYKWMVSEVVMIDESLKVRLQGKPHDTMLALGNLRTMGVKFVNVQTNLVASKAVQDADEDKAIEDLQRASEAKNTKTYVANVKKLMDADPGKLTFAEAAVIFDKVQTLKAGVRTVIEAGNLVTFTTPPKGGK